MRNMIAKLRYLLIVILLACLAIVTSCQSNYVTKQPTQTILGPPEIVKGDQAIEPIPAPDNLDLQKVALGSQLYQDTILSGNNTVSCATCHALDKGGTDRRVKSVGINNSLGSVNAPTIYNSSLNFKQFWDGRAETLEAQIDGPINNPKEMGSSWPEVIEKLKKSPQYAQQFKQIYDNGVTSDNVKNAIAVYEVSLYTPDSAFDRYLKGDKNALTDQQKLGYQRFKDYGCVSCHQGVLIGGNMFQKFGVFGDYFKDRGNVTEADYGRFNVTGKEEDRYSFKVPSLRNVELTSPYFHDGSATTLDQAVKVMIKYQLGRELPQEEIDLILEFLTTLTGQIQPEASS